MVNQFKTVVDFNKAQDYLDLCNQAGSVLKEERLFVRTEKNQTDYEVVATKQESSNFKAVLFKHGDEYVVAFLGTDFKNMKDIGTNVAMVAGKNPKQFEQAEQFVADMIREHHIPLDKLTAIGNSEGAAEAIHVKAMLGLKEAYTFNGYVPRLLKYFGYYLSNIYNFRMSGDIVSKGGHVVGEDYIVPPKNKPMWGIFGVPEWHRIANMGDCTQAIPAPVYEKLNPGWKNKYMLGILTPQEIANIPNPIYHLFEDAIHNKVRDNEVIDLNRALGGYYLDQMTNMLTNHINTNCAGTYYVKGYTKDDGTKVSPYYRTCGAQHNN